MSITQEQFDDLKGEVDELNHQLQALRDKPETKKIKPYEDTKRYYTLRVDRLDAGLPISDTSGTEGHFQSQIYITKIGTTSSLCTLIDGVQKKVNLA